MGITKLMHMKESPKCAYEHLHNGIKYILNEEKTCNGIWVGGNAGGQPQEILENFLETKKKFGKMDGRQGYHFVISFKPGEVDEQKAYDIVKDFCENYLGDHYDYVFAIHNDKAHMHGHIIFNSVSREDGYKYHYENGDWKKYIQPVTDRVCKKHGVSPLEFDEQQPVGESYISYFSKQNGRLNYGNIIRADIDFAIQNAKNMDDFFDRIQMLGYGVRIGHSSIYGDYFSLKMPGLNADGKEHAARKNHRLGKGYSWDEIQQRIKHKHGPRTYEDVMQKLNDIVPSHLRAMVTMKGRSQVGHRLYQAVNYYQLPNPYAVPAGRVRKDMLQINKLIRNCQYLETHQINSKAQLAHRGKQLETEIAELKLEQRSLYRVKDLEADIDSEQKEILKRCRWLNKELQSPWTLDDKSYEDMEDELRQLQEQIPLNIIENNERLQELNRRMKDLRNEKRMVDQLLIDEERSEPEKPVMAVTTGNGL